MSGYEESLKEFFSLALLPLQAEDLILRNILLNREDFCEYHPGILSTFETSLVYAMFKGLLSSKFAENHSIHWEMPGEGRTSMDLYFQKKDKGNNQKVGIEVKWWNVDGFCQDVEKLLKNQRNNHIHHGAILVLGVTTEGDKSESEILEKITKKTGYKVKLIEFSEIESYQKGNVKIMIEVALVLVC